MFKILDDKGDATPKVQDPPDIPTVLPFPINPFMQHEELALSTHIRNLIATYGEARVRKLLKETFGLREPGVFKRFGYR